MFSFSGQQQDMVYGPHCMVHIRRLPDLLIRTPPLAMNPVPSSRQHRSDPVSVLRGLAMGPGFITNIMVPCSQNSYGI